MKPFLSLILLLVVIAGGLWVTHDLSKSDKKDPLRVVMGYWPGYALLYVANEKNYFEEEGVELEIVQDGRFEEKLALFKEKKVDLMATLLSELVAINAGDEEDSQAVLVPDFSNGSDELIGLNIKKLPEIKGKRVGINESLSSRLFLARALASEGLTLRDVKMVRIDPTSFSSAVEEGIIDAAVSFAPFSIEAVENFGGTVLFSSKEIPFEMYDVIMAKKEVIERKQEQMVAFARAWDRVLKLYKEKPDEVENILANYVGVSTEDLTESLKGIHLLDLKEQNELLSGKKLIPVIEEIDTFGNFSMGKKAERLIDVHVLNTALHGRTTQAKPSS